MKVRCISDVFSTCLTKGKIYEVLEDCEERYLIINNDFNEKDFYWKDRFEIVEKDVEKEEFTFTEVIARIKSGEEYVCTKDYYAIKSIKFNEGVIVFNHCPDGGILGIKDTANFKLKKKIEYMTFLEAKEKGIPCHKDYEYEISISGKDGLVAFIKDLDKKVWTIEGEE